MEIQYEDHVFGFEPRTCEPFAGQLVLDGDRRELLARLVASEDECWYLDNDGERLPSERLFALSPWSCPGPDGPVKLLCRYLDLENGSVRFNPPESYPGELLRWVRTTGTRQDD